MKFVILWRKMLSVAKNSVYFIVFITFLGVSCQNVSREQVELSNSNEDHDLVVEDTTILHSWSAEDEMLGLGKIEFGDLDSMIARRHIRVLVPYTKTYYYIDGKERRGVAYDAFNLFEKHLNKQLNFYPPKVRVVFIPVTREQIIPMLNNGLGDIAMAGFTITPEREQLIDFSVPTLTNIQELVIGGPASPVLSGIEDLQGQSVYVHAKSSYENSIKFLNDSLKAVGLQPIHIKHLNPYLSEEDVLEMVNAGIISFTVLDNYIINYWSTVLDSLVLYPNLVLRRQGLYACAFRKNSPLLKKAVDQFIGISGKGTLTGNILFNNYLKNISYLHKAHSAEALAQLKKTELIFRKYGETYELDWLLLAAQGYQESQLNQNLVSGAGAVGIMQVLPSTAGGKPINVLHVEKLENNIHAGAKYMRYLIDTYFNDEALDPLNKQLFALASYNAGPARVAKLRKMSTAKGYDSNVWFNNVEVVAAQEIGRETVQYVSNIFKYYSSYRFLQRYSEESGKIIFP